MLLTHTFPPEIGQEIEEVIYPGIEEEVIQILTRSYDQ